MHKVLLLGAEPATTYLYRVYFERAGLGLVSSEIVEPIDDVIRLAKPAALVVDVSRGKPGRESLLDGIRSRTEFENLPIFILTGRPPPSAPGGAAADRPARRFQNLPIVVPEVVKAVTDALNGLGGINGNQDAVHSSPEVEPGSMGEPNTDFPLIDDSNAGAFKPGLSPLQRKLGELGEQLVAKEAERERGQSNGPADMNQVTVDKLENHQAEDQSAPAGKPAVAQKRTELAPGHRELEHVGEVTTVKDQTKAAMDRQNSLERELAQATITLAQASEQTSKLAAEVERLTAELKSAVKEKDALRTRVDELQALEGGKEIFLKQKLEAMEAYDSLSGELAQARNQLTEERSHRQRIEATMLDMELTKEDLAKQLAAISQSDLAQQDAVQSLRSKLDAATAKFTEAESLLQKQSREYRCLELRNKELEDKVNDLSSQLLSQTAVEKALRRREAEWKTCLVEQQAEVDRSRAGLDAKRTAIQSAKESIERGLNRLIGELNSEFAPLLEEQQAGVGSTQEAGASTEPLLVNGER